VEPIHKAHKNWKNNCIEALLSIILKKDGVRNKIGLSIIEKKTDQLKKCYD
jgi:hypothetical protein